jgi:hypothetical protein
MTSRYAVVGDTVFWDGCRCADDVDRASFEVLSEVFAKDKRSLFCWGYRIDGDAVALVDLTTVEPLNECYFRDRSRIYCTHYGYDSYDTKVVNADYASFEVLGTSCDTSTRCPASAFARDATRLFNHGRPEPVVRSPPTFRVIHACFAVDECAVYLLIQGGKHTDMVEVQPIEGADVGSFEVVTEEYARDHRRVWRYHVENDVCAPLWWDLTIVSGADPKRFDFETPVDWQPIVEAYFEEDDAADERVRMAPVRRATEPRDPDDDIPF